MGKFLIVSILCFALQVKMANGSSPSSSVVEGEDNLEACYVKFPFLYSALVEISDQDFLDDRKSLERISDIYVQLDKSSNEIQLCVDNIMSKAKSENSTETSTYVGLRMSEIRSLLLQRKLADRYRFVKEIFGMRLFMDLSRN